MAVLLAKSWINDAIDSDLSQKSRLAQNTASYAPSTLPVIIADVDFTFGDELSAQNLRLVNYPEDAVPAGAFTSFEDIFSHDDQRTIALTHIGINEPILNHKISGPGGKGSLSTLIEEGMRAVAVRMNDVNGVAGFVVPGDYIDVLFTRDNQTRRNGNNLVSDVLLQNLKVLGIDQNLNTLEGSPDIAKTVTLEVTNKQAQALNLAMDAGRLSLTLRRAGEVSIEPVKTVSLNQLTHKPQPSAPVKKSRFTHSPKQSEISGTAAVTIIRGEDRDEVKVVRDTQISTSELAGG